LSVFKITLILDDSVTAQATLLTNIQNTLSSIASNLAPPGVPGVPNNNIEVKKLS
jgi:hypothetical protein